MVLKNSDAFHSFSLGSREWLWMIQALSIPCIPETGNGFRKNNSFPPSAPETLECFSTKQVSSTLGAKKQRALPLWVTLWRALPRATDPSAMNSRRRRKATPSEGSAYRSEPVERSRMRPREGERSPRAYSEEQGQRLRQVNLGEGRASGARGKARVWGAAPAYENGARP